MLAQTCIVWGRQGKAAGSPAELGGFADAHGAAMARRQHRNDGMVVGRDPRGAPKNPHAAEIEYPSQICELFFSFGKGVQPTSPYGISKGTQTQTRPERRLLVPFYG
jgi:hypothetical protein